MLAHLRTAPALAHGLSTLPETVQPFAATQAAWRFYANPRLTLPQLAQPLIETARRALAAEGGDWALVVHDWSLLHYGRHRGKPDRVALAHRRDLGYELLTSLALDGRSGHPLAPVAQELRTQEGLYSTRAGQRLQACSQLDGLTPVFQHLEGLGLGQPLVHILDREADSVGHYRSWDREGWRFLVRADQERIVRHQGARHPLARVAQHLRRAGAMTRVRVVAYQEELVEQWVAQTPVILEGPARQYRVVRGRPRARNVPGRPLPLRLIVSDLRDPEGRVRAHWLLLTNLPAAVSAETGAHWYYFRWQIESYFRLMKQAGQQVESWQQEDGQAVARRLLVASMAAVLAWRLARSQDPRAPELRGVLIRLSGRQMKRGRDAPGFTVPALLAGLGVLLPMLALLERYDVAELRQMAQAFLPLPVGTESG